MNTDGSGLKNNILDVPMGKQAKLIAWPHAKDFVVLVIMNRIYSRERSRIIAFDLANGESEVLAENVIGQYVWHLHPSQEYMTFKVRDYDEGKDNLVLVDFNTSEAIPLVEKEKLRVWGRRWSPDGKKIALSREKELSIYDLEEKTSEVISQRNYEYEIGFDWTSGGQKFLLLAPIDGEYHLIVMNNNFQEEKKIRVPVPFTEGETYYIWGLEDQALLKSTDKSALWRVNLETEEWKKVY
jgi:tricorn protease-like protein